ncbi:unnamed protein product, partial [Symbiodinium pilosum]
LRRQTNEALSFDSLARQLKTMRLSRSPQFGCSLSSHCTVQHRPGLTHPARELKTQSRLRRSRVSWNNSGGCPGLVAL